MFKLDKDRKAAPTPAMYVSSELNSLGLGS